jgi:pimeloyl-ACP methyl ester carboxylesterase
MTQLQLLIIPLLLVCIGAQTRPAATSVSNQREVKFDGAGGAKLAGSLLLPEHFEQGAKLPAVVFVSGSGSTDRDGNQRPLLITDTQKQIAHHLAKRGFASLRYDKRGIAASAPGAPSDLAGMTDFYTWENFVADVVAAYRFLQQQPEIDLERIALVGHSEGGMLVLMAASELEDNEHPPHALVLLATPGRPIEDLISDQLSRLVKMQGAPDAQAKRILDKASEISGHIRATGSVPDNVPPGLQAR